MKKRESVGGYQTRQWFDSLDKSKDVIYLAIVERLEHAIATGELLPGQLLPTHRKLAAALGVNVSTVSRAYGEAKRRGLIGAGRRRGSHVLGRKAFPPAQAAEFQSVISLSEAAPAGLIDLTTNRPIGDSYAHELARTLTELGQRPETILTLQDYQSCQGTDLHRSAAAAWLRRSGLDAAPEQALICNGTHHALVTALLAVAKPGDVILTEELTYPGLKALASLIGVRLHGLPIDAEGLLPEAVAEACATQNPRALICVPNLHNPTNAILSMKRRQALAELAREHGLLVIEDDVYGELVERRLPPLATFAPERTFVVTSLSKTIAPGLRVGFLLAPSPLVARTVGSLRRTPWMVSPIMAEVVAQWILDGTAERLVGQQRARLQVRQKMAAEALAGHDIVGYPSSTQLWLFLPPLWRSESFHLQARENSVAVMPAEAFAVGQVKTPHAVRLNLSAAQDDGQLKTALQILVQLLVSRPEPAYLVA